ncbi:MAG: sensor domain-containing diguanylate cyclase [Gammaproteobacteria bacterium]|nr:MAG: sensor domain-containing diguanylate cyclase [Gammaproteobacteria bacterium]
MEQTDSWKAFIANPSLEKVFQLLSKTINHKKIGSGHLFALMQDGELVCKHLSMPESWQCIEKSYKDYHFSFNENDPLAIAFETKKVVIVNKDDICNYSGNCGARFDRWQAIQLICIPIFKACGDSQGVLLVFEQNDPITDKQVASLEHILSTWQHLLDHFSEYQNLRTEKNLLNSAAKERKKFLNLVCMLNQLASLEQVLEQVVEEILELYPFFNISVVLLDRGDGYLSFQKSAISDERWLSVIKNLNKFYKANPQFIEYSSTASGVAFLQRKSLFFPDVQSLLHLPMSEHDREGIRILGSQAAMQLPLVYRDQSIGVIMLVRLENPGNLPQNIINEIEQIGRIIASAIINAGLYTKTDEQRQQLEDQQKQINSLNTQLQKKIDKLHYLSTHDQLTGLNNFGSFRNYIECRISELERANHPKMSFMICDIDHFKQFNDTYGHMAGNICLKEVANRILHCRRQMDFVARYGGEEFVVVLPTCSLTEVEIVAERIRAAIFDTSISLEDCEVTVSLSVGCSEYRHGESWEETLKRADEALYIAKNNGRNCIEISC